MMDILKDRDGTLYIGGSAGQQAYRRQDEWSGEYSTDLRTIFRIQQLDGGATQDVDSLKGYTHVGQLRVDFNGSALYQVTGKDGKDLGFAYGPKRCIREWYTQDVTLAKRRMTFIDETQMGYSPAARRRELLEEMEDIHEEMSDLEHELEDENDFATEDD